MTRRFWTSEDDALFRALYPDTPTAEVARRLGRSIAATYQRADKFKLAKSAAYLASPAACRTNGRQGVGTRFTTGHTPANKGLRRPGWSSGRMKATQFRKGERQGVAVKLYKPIGTERVSKDGYRERKVNDGMPLQRRWRAVHLLVWEAAHGALPPAHAVVFVNGDKTDIRLDNLACIPRADLMRRNSVHNLPAPLPQMVQLLGALNRKINRRAKRDEEQDRRPAQSPVRGAGRASGPGEADGARPREGDCRCGARDRGLGEGRSAVHASDWTDARDGIHRAPRGRTAPASRGGRVVAIVGGTPRHSRTAVSSSPT